MSMTPSRPNAQHPHHRIGASALLVAVLTASVLACAAPAFAQERAKDFVEPRVSRTQFQQFAQRVGLASDQRQITTNAFADYEATLKDLTERLDQQALAAGRGTVDDSLSGKARVQAEELKRLRIEVLKVYLQAGPEVDAALDALVGGVQVLLTDDQQAKFADAERWLHREIMLHPRASAATYQEYAGDGVDVLQLVDEARAQGAEFATLPGEALGDILSRYEVSLDKVLMDTTSADRQGSIQRKIASIAKDQETLHQQEQAALQRWQRLYELNRQTVNQIAGAAGGVVGQNAADAFKQRFDRESFSWLYPRRKPDRQIEWMRQQQLATETMQKAEQVYADYLQKRDGLSRSAIDMMLKARLEFQTFLYAMMDPASIDERVRGGLYEDLLKNTGEQSHLESTVSSQLEALLDDQHRQQMRDAMKRPDRPTRSLTPH
jgi:hypothetical protein